MLIHVSNLKVSAIIGVYPPERLNPQTLLIDYSFEYDATQACLHDDFKQAIDYDNLSQELIKITQESKFFLIETLAERLAAFLKNKSLIKSGRVLVKKPEALKAAEYSAAEVIF